MKNHERIIITGVFGVLVVAWLGFLLHVSPRFAGSGTGTVFGISGAVLMLVPLVYVIGKRFAFFRPRLTKYVSLQTWLTIHVYSGIAGALLAIIHTGHKYVSPLGIALTTTMLLVVVTGYILRYLTPYVNRDIKDKLLLLQSARGDLDNAWGVLETAMAKQTIVHNAPLLKAGLASLGLWPADDSPKGRIITLADGVANLEYSIRTDELLKRWFSRALTVHILLSVTMYMLLTLHVWSEIHLGLRWFS
jgi:hypothetical protein